MQKRLILTIIALIGFAIASKAQSKDGMTDIKYRRSSLHTILMESDNFPRKDTVIKAYYNAPFPDKYNDHMIGAKSFDPRKYPITDEERAAAGKKQSAAGSMFKGLVSQTTAGIVDSTAADVPLIINKYFKENKIANQLVAKWFDRQEDGSFDWNLIAERGVFDASFLSSKTAQASSDGKALLVTAGLELINNTFVVVSRMNFVTNEIVAASIRDAAKAQAANIKIALLKETALKAADAAYEKAKEGYSVWATSYLYKLVWNDTIQTIFFTDLYMDKATADSKKKAAFDNSDLFKLEYVGNEKATSLVTFSLKEKRTEDQIVVIATIRTIEAVYAKLQKKYDVFKTKTPLYTGNPITAKIGMKEGLEGGEKFDVLELNIDPKTGVSKYKSVGKIEVDKNLIWDNRYNIGEEPVAEGEKSKPVLDRTTFKGGSKYYPGLLIKQIK
jgi:hypothetical protein